MQKQRSLADKVVKVDEIENYSIKSVPSKIYTPLKMQKRNEYMVDRTDYLVAVWDGTTGGTKNCIDYYKRTKGLEKLIIIDPSNKI